MPKFSTAFAASALLIALSAPSFAADLDTSTSQHGSTTIQNHNLNAGGSAQVNGRTDLNGSISSGRTSTMDRDRDRDRDQSAQMPGNSRMDRDRDQSAQMPGRDKDRDKDRDPGRSSTSPGHEMQEHGSVPGSPGASGFAPGHTDR